MATRLRSPTASAPPVHVRPLSWQEAREARAIRLALCLLVVAVHAEGFTPGSGPLPDDTEGRWAWIRAHLAPLAAQAPTVRAICDVLDPQRYSRAWYTRPALDGQICGLRRRVQRLARCMAAARPRRGTVS